MMQWIDLSKDELTNFKTRLQSEYEEWKSLGLKLDMSRGKPSPSQLDISNGLLEGLKDYHTSSGADARNYGILDGIPEAKQLFSELLGICADNMIIGGNASLNLMYDSIVRFYLFGTGGETPWCKLEKVKWLCPSPGYDRHFSICEDMGMEMITIPMTESGPDMDMIERLVSEDEAIKGIWCVPMYSNPQGIIYSDETVKRLVTMKTAAKDFRIFWDNAYGVHHIYKENAILNIIDEAKAAGNEDRPMYFFSTSKISFPGSGVSLMASGSGNIEEAKKHMFKQTIGYDKLNQLRHVRYFKNADGVKAHMKLMAEALKPKFDMVLNTLKESLGGTGLASWCEPQGGYFVAVDTLEDCAKETVRLAKEAGVVMTGAGATYPYKNDPKDTNIRIAPSYPTLDELEKAMKLFCVCVKLAGVNKLLDDK